ncbi:MAG: hypothetical protein GX046_03010 [Tissierellia bacterium]|nr:hypothetical protein [Tissierellia bacterium]
MKIRLISMRALIEEAFFPERVLDYCSRCENYNMHFACPNHQFNISALLNRYPFVLVISHNLPVNIDEYYYWRDIIDPILMGYENKLMGQSLLAGSCRNCDFCFNKGAQDCEFPQLLRYSLESLGFDLSALLAQFFNEELNFRTDNLNLVYGMLLKQRPDQIYLSELEGELLGISY